MNTLSNGIYTFNSNDIYVFPCARPGGSSLASEYNFTHLSGRIADKASYVIGSVEIAENTYILQVVLDGYYFEIKTTASESLDTKKLILWLETLPESENNEGWSHVTRRVCGVEYDSSANEWTKGPGLDNNDRFSALYAVDNISNSTNIAEKDKAKLTYIALDLNVEANWMKDINFKGEKGDKGDTGATGAPGAKGEPGVGIKEIKKTSSSSDGKVDIYTITLTDKNTYTFTVTNGTDGSAGAGGHTPVIDIQNGYWYIDGVNTNQAAQGNTGKGISSISQTSSINNVDTYTITYTEGDPTEFAVTNGLTPYIGENGNWWIGDDDKGVKAAGDNGLTTAIQIGDKRYEHTEGLITLPEFIDTNTTYEFKVNDEKPGIVVTPLFNGQPIMEGVEGAQTQKKFELDLNNVYSKPEVDGMIQTAINDLNGSGIYAIAFDANDGTGIMTPVICISDSYSLPTSSFNPPEDRPIFKGWCEKAQAENDDDIKTAGAKIEINRNTILYAIWAANAET